MQANQNMMQTQGSSVKHCASMMMALMMMMMMMVKLMMLMMATDHAPGEPLAAATDDIT
jgi:hypothetical protein